MKPDSVGTAFDATVEVDRLRQWAKVTQAEIQEILSSMAPLQHRLAAAQERLDLITRLLGLAEKTDDAIGSRASGSAPGSAENRQPQLAVPRVRIGTDVEAEIERLLEEAGEPVHIGEIRRALIERGVPLPGRGDEANIILRLRRAEDRFTRTGRGMYGLRKWGLPSVPAGRVVKRTVRREARSG